MTGSDWSEKLFKTLENIPDIPAEIRDLVSSHDDLRRFESQSLFGRDVTSVDAVAVLRELLSERGRVTDRPIPRDLPDLAVQVAQSLWLATWRQAQAVAALADTDALPEAAPNARAALEKAIVLAALVNAIAAGEGEAFYETLEVELGRRVRAALKSAAGAPDVDARVIELADRVADVLSAQSIRPPGSAHIERLCGRLQNGTDAYAVYRMLSTMTHSGVFFVLPDFRSQLMQERWDRPTFLDGETCTVASASVWAVVSANAAIHAIAPGELWEATSRLLDKHGFTQVSDLLIGGATQ